jgi:hypothetical protein
MAAGGLAMNNKGKRLNFILNISLNRGDEDEYLVD